MNSIYISCLASKETLDYFKEKKMHIKIFVGIKGTYDAVDHHPDMYLFFDEVLFGDNRLSYVDVKADEIGAEYPYNVKYNVAKVGKYVIGNFKHVSKKLRVHFEKKSYHLIDVRQGYSKCSTAVIGNDAIITSDKGIYKQATAHGLEALLIKPGHILLEGLEYGFIGGCTLSFKDVVFFNGDITKHPDYDKIRLFVEKKHLKMEWVSGPLTDIGSFILV